MPAKPGGGDHQIKIFVSNNEHCERQRSRIELGHCGDVIGVSLRSVFSIGKKMKGWEGIDRDREYLN